MVERVRKGSKEYKNLQAVAAMLEATSVNHERYFVLDAFFDFGQNWWWTTICTDTHQVLNPREWEVITNASTVEELVEAVQMIKADEYFQDK